MNIEFSYKKQDNPVYNFITSQKEKKMHLLWNSGVSVPHADQKYVCSPRYLFSTNRSKMVPLLQFFIIRASVFS